MEKNKERLVELLKDNELCKECGKKICTGCGAYLSLWSEAEMLASRGVFCPQVAIGTEVYIVFDDYDPEFSEPVFFGSEKIVDVSVCGFWFELNQEGAPVDFYPWEELGKKDMFFLEKSEAEERYKELMKKYEREEI